MTVGTVTALTPSTPHGSPKTHSLCAVVWLSPAAGYSRRLRVAMWSHHEMKEGRVSVSVAPNVRQYQLFRVFFRDCNLFEGNFEVLHQREEMGQLVFPVFDCQSVG